MPIMSRKTFNILVVSALAALVAILAARHSPMLFHGFLFGPDSYELMARVKASVAAGHLVYVVPGDNGGRNIPLFWSHLLDAWIIGTAAPLAAILGWHRALHLAGAMIGPESLMAVAVAAIPAARALGGGARLQLLPGLFVMSSPSLLGYSLFGRVDHHVLLGADALMVGTAVVRSVTADLEYRYTAQAGAWSALGVWLSPEFVPFALTAWSMLLLSDAEQVGRAGPRGLWFSLTFTIGLTLIIAVDPPYGGRFVTVLDRVSAAYVELGFFMVACTFAASRAPAVKHTWAAAFSVAVPVIVAVGIWGAIHPVIFEGVTRIMGTPAAFHFLSIVSEMQPVTTLPTILTFLLIPVIAVLTGSVLILHRRRDPIGVFSVGIAGALVAFAISHARFSIYVQAAGAVVASVLLERILLRARSPRFGAIPLGVALIAVIIIISPLASGDLLPTRGAADPQRACNPRAAVTALNTTAPHIVLAPISDAPAILYFSHATVVAGPYTSRAGAQLGAALNAFEEQDLHGEYVPKSVRKTGARYILVCTYDPASLKTLYGALAHGKPPAWAVRQPIPHASGYKLFKIQPR